MMLYIYLCVFILSAELKYIIFIFFIVFFLYNTIIDILNFIRDSLLFRMFKDPFLGEGGEITIWIYMITNELLLLLCV